MHSHCIWANTPRHVSGVVGRSTCVLWIWKTQNYRTTTNGFRRTAFFPHLIGTKAQRPWRTFPKERSRTKALCSTFDFETEISSKYAEYNIKREKRLACRPASLWQFSTIWRLTDDSRPAAAAAPLMLCSGESAAEVLHAYVSVPGGRVLVACGLLDLGEWAVVPCHR